MGRIESLHCLVALVVPILYQYTAAQSELGNDGVMGLWGCTIVFVVVYVLRYW